MTASKSDRRKARNAVIKQLRRARPDLHEGLIKSVADKLVKQAIANLRADAQLEFEIALAQV